eukprot:3388947-Alexandrium_andersonii.AAC.1
MPTFGSTSDLRAPIRQTRAPRNKCRPTCVRLSGKVRSEWTRGVVGGARHAHNPAHSRLPPDLPCNASAPSTHRSQETRNMQHALKPRGTRGTRRDIQTHATNNNANNLGQQQRQQHQQHQQQHQHQHQQHQQHQQRQQRKQRQQHQH